MPHPDRNACPVSLPVPVTGTPPCSPLNCSFLLLSQPDLLNFKKGWLTKQYEDGQVSVQSRCVASEGLGSRYEAELAFAPAGL